MRLFKNSFRLLLCCLTLSTTPFTTAEENQKQVLMVLSGYGQVGNDQGQKERPGYEFDEFSKAYLVFKENGIAVDIASPKGGVVQADKYDPEKPFNARVLADKAIMAKLENTLSTASIDVDNYHGVFVVGGKGAMFDLPKDPQLQSFIADIYERQGVVAAVCHGPAALVDVKLTDGSYLVQGKAVNGFTNHEEQLFGKKWLPEFDFLLQDKLIERGGRFQSSDIMLSHVASDGRLITGQNPASTVAVALEMVKALGVSKVNALSFRDDRTMEQVALFLAGEREALETLASDAEYYHIPLAGMYGYYYLNVAKSDQQLQQALSLMQLAQQSINNPRLDMQIAQTQHKLGKHKKAVATLNAILAQHPDFEPAEKMLSNLTTSS